MAFLLRMHSDWRWLVLLLIVAALGLGLWGWLGRKPWSRAATILARAYPILIDIQVLLGIALYVVEKRWAVTGEGTAFINYFHPILGLLTLGVGHMVSARIKRASSDEQRYKQLALGTLAVIVLVVLTVPHYAWRMLSS